MAVWEGGGKRDEDWVFGGPRCGREEMGREGGAMRCELELPAAGRRTGALAPPEERWAELSAGNMARGRVGFARSAELLPSVMLNDGTVGGLGAGFLNGGGGGGMAFLSRSILSGGLSWVI